MTYEERERIARDVVIGLGLSLRESGQPHEEVACVLAHALRLAEWRSSHTTLVCPPRPAGVPSAQETIDACKAELRRRAG